MSTLDELLAMTGCRDAADLQDMANVGKSLMERIAEATKDGPLKGWSPMDCPTEIVTDLADTLAEAWPDALRYRYLRSRDAGPHGSPPPAGLFIGQVPANLILTEDDADAAIDAARQGPAGDVER